MTNPWRSISFFLAGLLLIALGLLYLLRKESGGKDSTYKADRIASETRHTKMKEENDSLRHVALAERQGRQENARKSEEKIGSLTGALNASKERERRARANPTILTLTDTIFGQYDTIIAVQEHRRKADSVSFEREISTLQAKSLNLEVYSDNLFTENLKLYTDLEGKEKRIDRLKKWVIGLVGTTGLSIILLAIALI